MIKNICVDLDGTLWSGDCLWLNMKIFLKNHPFKIYKILIWWLKGRQILKYELAKYWNNPKIKCHKKIIKRLEKYLSQGVDLYLITGSAQLIADNVASHLGFFKGAMGSTPSINLVGKEKAKVLLEKFGHKNFIYIGNDAQDIHVWKHSHSIIAVNPTKRATKWLSKEHKQLKEIIYT